MEPSAAACLSRLWERPLGLHMGTGCFPQEDQAVQRKVAAQVGLVIFCRVCLAEVYQDRALIEDFMNRKSDYQDPKVRNVAGVHSPGFFPQKGQWASAPRPKQKPMLLSHLQQKKRTAIHEKEGQEWEGGEPRGLLIPFLPATSGQLPDLFRSKPCSLRLSMFLPKEMGSCSQDAEFSNVLKLCPPVSVQLELLPGCWCS